ncbi:hypothetical protein EVA_05348 [gut metagenome]|uniref:Uncharacterized protein n=1 Tax=gut metagenome TaxID=749906 RepID=J9GZZ5_9ZZZZ
MPFCLRKDTLENDFFTSCSAYDALIFSKNRFCSPITYYFLLRNRL